MGIIVGPPSFDDPPGCGQALEDVLIEAFVAQATVQALDECVLHWLAGGDVVPADTAILLPTQHHMRRQLGPVVADHQQGGAAPFYDVIEFAHHPATGQRCIHHQRQAFAGEVVHHHKHPKAAAVGQVPLSFIEN